MGYKPKDRPVHVDMAPHQSSSVSAQSSFVRSFGGRAMHTDNLPEWLQAEFEKIAPGKQVLN